MLAVSPELARRYEAWLVQRNVMTGQRPHYHKWLRYYPAEDCHPTGYRDSKHQADPPARGNSYTVLPSAYAAATACPARKESYR